MKDKIIKLSKIKELIKEIPENSDITKKDITINVISQQITYIKDHGCSGLKCAQCCLCKKCSHTPANGKAIASALYTHAHLPSNSQIKDKK
jgi:hypothetical protein